MTRRCRLALAVVLPLLAPAPAGAAEVTTPEAHLGRQPGVDFQLADWKEVSGYYRALADQSARVQLAKVGSTTEGRDFLLATISSEANLARLDRIKADVRRVADPRGLTAGERERVLSETPVVLFVSPAMHATETAAPQFAMEFAHRLATSDEEPYKTAREKLVVLIAPTLNPDGLDHVVSWYRRTVGTPHEGSGLTKLYQYYTGHDNNRDWFGLTQNETRIVTGLLYSEWFPQIYWDVHQQGSGRERFFVPPYRDPLNPNLDPAIITGIDAIGSRAMFDMTREGLTGVSTGVTYDMWWNGGNRNVPVRHNIIGILTEAASVKLASPIFIPRSELQPPSSIEGYAPSNRFPAPWPGGWWRLRDIIDYEHAFGRSLLRTLSSDRRTWLENAMGAAERAIEKGRQEAPRAWLITTDNRDPGAVRRLVDTLLIGGVEIYAARADFEADGRSWPKGTLIVPRDQPYGAHVKDLFEIQRYPEGAPPYDVAGWTFPLLLGVRRVEVTRPFEVERERIESVDEALAAIGGFSTETLWDSGDSETWRRVFAELTRGQSVHLRISEAHGLSFSPQDAPDELAAGKLDRLPRIGVYAPWTGSMDEGWLRWVLDTWGVDHVRVRNEMIRAGQLRDFLDVLVIPSVGGRTLDAGRSPGTAPSEFTGGLDPEGAVAVQQFVRAGGTLIVMAGSADWAIELFELPLEDVTRGDDAKKKEFSCPGSVLRAVPSEEQDLTAGLPDSMALFFSSSAAWRVVPPDRAKALKEGREPDERHLDVLLRYAPTRTLLSGWIRAPEVVAGQAAWVRAEHGEGRIHLFGFRPQYRGWTQGTFQLLFRAMLFDRRRD